MRGVLGLLLLSARSVGLEARLGGDGDEFEVITWDDCKAPSFVTLN